MFNTHKNDDQVKKQKYRNSVLIKKKKKILKKQPLTAIGSDLADTQIFLDRIGSGLNKWYRCITSTNVAH